MLAVRDRMQRTRNQALFEAINRTDLKSVTSLLESGADANAVSGDTRSWWSKAWDSLRGRSNSVEWSSTTLYAALGLEVTADGNLVILPQQRDPRIVATLIRHGAKPFVPRDGTKEQALKGWFVSAGGMLGLRVGGKSGAGIDIYIGPIPPGDTEIVTAFKGSGIAEVPAPPPHAPPVLKR